MLLAWLHFAEQEGADDEGDGVDASASPVAFGAISNSEYVVQGLLLHHCYVHVVIGLDDSL